MMRKAQGGLGTILTVVIIVFIIVLSIMMVNRVFGDSSESFDITDTFECRVAEQGTCTTECAEENILSTQACGEQEVEGDDGEPLPVVCCDIQEEDE